MLSERQISQHTEVNQILHELRYLDLTGSVEYESTCPVAQGGFGDIYKGRCRQKDDTECRVAIKRLRIYLDGGRDVTRVFRREIRAWYKLSHPNVLPLAGYMLEETGGPSRLPSLVSEWMENGNILEFVKSNRDCNINRLAHGMAEGLAYLHENGVVHSDFKSGNVLISSTYEALISDFGAAHVHHDAQAVGVSSTVTGTRGSCRWLAYELLADSEKYQTATKESDTWSFGMTLLEVLTGDQPYSHLKRDGQVMFAITQKTLPSPPTEGLIFGSRLRLWEVCMSCWRWEPSQRPTMTVIALRLRAALLSAEQEFDSMLLFTSITASAGEKQDFQEEDILHTLSNPLHTPDKDSSKESKKGKGNLLRLLLSSLAKATKGRVARDKRETKQPYQDLLEVASISSTQSTRTPDTVGASSPLIGSCNSSINANGRMSSFELSAVIDFGTEPVYRAKALHSYEADPNDPNEISFDENDVLEILDKGGKWWQVRKADGTVGIAPSDYLLLLCGTQTVYRAKALYACQHNKANPSNPNGISFDKNDTLEILAKRGKWCQAKKANGPVGTVPSNYLQLI